MALNIKNEKTHQMARELAALQGVSIVVAVTNALEEKLRTEQEEQMRREKRKGRLERLMAFSREMAPLMKNDITYEQIMDEMYDEYGLPR